MYIDFSFIFKCTKFKDNFTETQENVSDFVINVITLIIEGNDLCETYFSTSYYSSI